MKINKLYLTTLAVACGFSSTLMAAEADVSQALDGLLRQADYWENNQRPDLARQALERYLVSQPDNPDVLYRLARQAREEGRLEDADRWSQRLQDLVPDDQRLAELDNVAMDQAISQVELSRVRDLARQGRYADAIAGYRDLLNDRAPSRALAPEFYQTLAGTNNGWTEARNELRRLVEIYPEDQNLASAYAEVLTYQESTRREGIDRLDALVDERPNLRAPLRQGLLWLGARPSDRSRYDRYMNRWPDDAPVMTQFEQGAVATRRQAGFTALNEGRLDTAEQAFRESLRVNASDADAQAGLGLVALRRENFADAAQWLQRAMNTAPARRDEWEAAYTNASYYARLASGEGGGTNLESELARVRALGDERSTGTRLIEADILRRLGQLEASQAIYRDILSAEPQNESAQLGLVDVMRDRATTETPFTAEATLRSALRMQPEHTWARVDLARLLLRQGLNAEAERILASLTDFDATNEQREAAASLFAELQDWGRVESLIGGVSPEDRTPGMLALLEQSRVRQQFDRVQALLEEERTVEATVLLESLYDQEDLGPAMAGQLAMSLSQMGRSDLALRWVQRDLSRVGDKLPSQYGNHVLVLARLDRVPDAERLLGELRRATGQQLDEREALMSVRHGFAVILADDLREQGQLATAYDQLAQPLREAPDDETLLLAMARVYASGERHVQAEQVYNYVLERNAGSVPALEGAVQAALATGDDSRASALVERYQLANSSNPEHLMLAARVAQQRGDENEALRLLNRARGRVPNRAVATRSDGNPFNDSRPGSNALALDFLPGREPGDFSSTSLAGGVQPSALERRIDAMIDDISIDRAPRLNAGIELSVRSGESGMSQLERLEAAPLEVSAVPLGSGRVALEVTPALLNSGTIEDGAAQARFGRNALSIAAGALGGQSAVLSSVLTDIETAATGFFSARARADLAKADPVLPASEKLRLEAEANQAQNLFEQTLERNPVFEAGIQLERLSDAQKQVLSGFFGEDVLATQGLGLSNESLAAFQASRKAMQQAFAATNTSLQARGTLIEPDYQRGAGLGLGLRYDNGSFSADIGSTPLGFEETNLIGGLQWQPALGSNSRLNLRMEQRPVKDSILSYAGTQDPYSGESWGGVVRRGAGIGLAYQSAAGAGLYTDLKGYNYIGNQVADNRQIDFSVGGYIRPFEGANSSLQTGIHLNVMGFSDDLSYFTVGHGGYFSPQEFFSASFPVTYEATNGQLRYAATFTPGYQSFTLDGNMYFPTDPEAQELLNIFAIMGAVPNSVYEGYSQNGLGLTLQGNADYRISDSLLVGGSVGYNGFGGFDDYAFQLYMRYSKGDR
jgi:tetratricopeptide (TPR) repeat protein